MNLRSSLEEGFDTLSRESSVSVCIFPVAPSLGKKNCSGRKRILRVEPALHSAASNELTRRARRRSPFPLPIYRHSERLRLVGPEDAQAQAIGLNSCFTKAGPYHMLPS